MAKSQSCMNCIAFDSYANYCRLSNAITFDNIYFDECGIKGNYKRFRPIEKCNKPKNKKMFFAMYKKL